MDIPEPGSWRWIWETGGPLLGRRGSPAAGCLSQWGQEEHPDLRCGRQILLVRARWPELLPAVTHTSLPQSWGLPAHRSFVPSHPEGCSDAGQGLPREDQDEEVKEETLAEASVVSLSSLALGGGRCRMPRALNPALCSLATPPGVGWALPSAPAPRGALSLLLPDTPTPGMGSRPVSTRFGLKVVLPLF